MLLDVRNVSKKFPIKEGILRRAKHFVHAVTGVSLTIGEQETLGLVGESGSGKSTLGRLIMQLIPETEGDVYFMGQRLTGLSFRQLRAIRQRMQMIFQDPGDSLNSRMTVGQIVGEPLDINQIGTPKERRKKVDELLEIVGVRRAWRDRYPHEFSGGQRQRIGIARALALSPKLIIADEPVSALDVSIQAQILNLMKDLQEQYQISYLFIAHDIHVIRFVSDHIAVMYLGKIVEIADSETVYTTPQHPYTKILLASVPLPNPQEKQNFQMIQGEVPSMIHLPTGCAFHPRCPIAENRCRVEYPQLNIVDTATNHAVRCFYPSRNVSVESPK